jgi:hypothetical protein
VRAKQTDEHPLKSGFFCFECGLDGDEDAVLVIVQACSKSERKRRTKWEGRHASNYANRLHGHRKAVLRWELCAMCCSPLRMLASVNTEEKGGRKESNILRHILCEFVPVQRIVHEDVCMHQLWDESIASDGQNQTRHSM